MQISTTYLPITSVEATESEAGGKSPRMVCFLNRLKHMPLQHQSLFVKRGERLLRILKNAEISANIDRMKIGHADEVKVVRNFAVKIVYGYCKFVDRSGRPLRLSGSGASDLRATLQYI